MEGIQDCRIKFGREGGEEGKRRMTERREGGGREIFGSEGLRKEGRKKESQR